VCREKQQLRQQANEIEYLIRLLTQEITFHERAGFKVTAITQKERELQQQKDKEEAKAVKAVNDDIQLQVTSLNNQLRILQMQETKQTAIEQTLGQIHDDTIKQLEE
jgi:hypothetical protein